MIAVSTEAALRGPSWDHGTGCAKCSMSKETSLLQKAWEEEETERNKVIFLRLKSKMATEMAIKPNKADFFVQSVRLCCSEHLLPYTSLCLVQYDASTGYWQVVMLLLRLKMLFKPSLTGCFLTPPISILIKTSTKRTLWDKWRGLPRQVTSWEVSQ